MKDGYQEESPIGSAHRLPADTTEELPSLEDDHPSSETVLQPATSITRNAVIVGSAFIASRLLGVVREIVIASRFGTSPDYDSYVAAFRVPDLLFLIVMSGAFGSAFIPVFGGMLSKDDREGAWRLASAVLTYTLVALAVTSALVLVFAGPLVRFVIAPGLAPEQSELATNLTRLLLLSPLLLGIGIAFKGMLEAQERFALAAYAPVFYNLGIIFGAIALTPQFGIYGLAYGVVIGAFFHAFIQFVGLFRGGLQLRWNLDRATPGLMEVVRLMGPRVLGQAGFQVNFIVMTNFASRLGPSNVGALNYAYQLFMLPYGVLALSLSTVIFPLMARQYQAGSLERMKATLSQALAPLLFLSFPAAAGLFFFRTSIVQVLFEIGSFGNQSTRLVSEALAFFAVGLIGFAVIEAVTRAFYAMHDTRTPVIISVSAVLINVILSAVLSQWIGIGGLALALAIASTIEMLLLAVILQGRIGAFARAFWSSTGRSVLATLVFSPIAFWFGNMLGEATDPSVAGRSVQTYLVFGYAVVTMALAYFVVAWVMGAAETLQIARRVPVLGASVARLLEPRFRSGRS